MSRGKASHPNTHTPEQLDAAFERDACRKRNAFLRGDPVADLEKLRKRVCREQRGKRKLKPLLRAAGPEISEILPSTEPPADFRSRAAAIASLTEEEIAEALARVRQVRTVVRGRFSSAYKPRREASVESLDPHGDVKRERIEAPFTLPTEIRNRIELAEAARKDGSHPEPPIKPTRLDHALTENGRYALARYLEDRSIELESRKDNGSGLAGWRPSPLTPEKQRALDRIDFIHKLLCPEDKFDLLSFTRMFLPVDDRLAPTVTEFGSGITGYCEKTVAEGAFLGVMARLASRLHHLLKIVAATREVHDRASSPSGG